MSWRAVVGWGTEIGAETPSLVEGKPYEIRDGGGVVGVVLVADADVCSGGWLGMTTSSRSISMSSGALSLGIPSATRSFIALRRCLLSFLRSLVRPFLSALDLSFIFGGRRREGEGEMGTVVEESTKGCFVSRVDNA